MSSYEKKRGGDLESNSQEKVGYSRVCFSLHCFLPAVSPLFTQQINCKMIIVYFR